MKNIWQENRREWNEKLDCPECKMSGMKRGTIFDNDSKQTKKTKVDDDQIIFIL